MLREYTYPEIQVSDTSALVTVTARGLLGLSTPPSLTQRFSAVADVEIPDIPSPTTPAFAVSYVHAASTFWTGRAARGKFLADTRSRLITTLTDMHVPALWLDQVLAQRRRSDSGWAVVGLLPYATFRVLVIANRASFTHIINAYIALDRLPYGVLRVASTHQFLIRLTTAWNVEQPCPEGTPVNFVELCRFWPMLERAVASHANGMIYEPVTLSGLRHWTRVLGTLHHSLREEIVDANDMEDILVQMRYVFSDMSDMVYYTILADSGSDRTPGRGYAPLTELASATRALGSGALMAAPLYDPSDRAALLVAGICFSLLANLSSSHALPRGAVTAILDDPYATFHLLAQTAPTTGLVVSHALSGANELYNRPTIDEIEIAHASVTDELTIFDERSARIPLSRIWMGQLEIIPHLAMCLGGPILDIGERAINCHSAALTNLMTDGSGKRILHLLSNGPLTDDGPPRAIVALSKFATVWAIRKSEEEQLGGLGGWNSSPAFLGICNPEKKIFSIEAVALVHFANSEYNDMADGRLPGERGVTFMKDILRRSVYPLQKTIWLKKWFATHFDERPSLWYMTDSPSIYTFKWEKWLSQSSSASTAAAPGNNRIFVKYIKLCAIHIQTQSTRPQIPLDDAINFSKTAILIAQKQVSSLTSSQSSESGTQNFLRCAFYAWIGLLNGLYDAYDRKNSTRSFSDATEMHVFIPSCSLAEGHLLLASDDIWRLDSSFMQGLRMAGHAFTMVRSADDNAFLTWDLESINEYWKARNKILSTLNVESLHLVFMLINILEASETISSQEGVSVGSSSFTRGVELQTSTLKNNGEIFKLQMEAAIVVTVNNIVSSPIRRLAVSALIEHVIGNSRSASSEMDWRISNELRDQFQRAMGIDDSRENKALRELSMDVQERIDALHRAKRHVEGCCLLREDGQSAESAAMQAFMVMTNVETPEAEPEKLVALEYKEGEATDDTREYMNWISAQKPSFDQTKNIE